MKISLQCNNKGCNKINEPYYDPNQNKIFCSFCDGEMPNISSFMMNHLKRNKQVKKKSKIAFSVVCSSCSFEDKPVYHNKQFICSKCKKVNEKLPHSFKMLLLQTMSKSQIQQSDDESDDESDVEEDSG